MRLLRSRQAMAEVGVGTYLYVNGREVAIENSVFRRPRLDGPESSKVYRGSMPGTVPVDLGPYLRPGRNCIGLYCRQVGDSQLIYLQGKAVVGSGEVVSLDSDENWRFGARAPEGWSEVGLDDSGWTAAETSDWDDPKRIGSHYYYDFLSYYYLVSEGGGWLGPGFPVYDGRLVLENPGEAKLFYDAAEPVVVRVRVPAGLVGREPRLAWALTRADEGAETELATGEVAEFTRADGSLVYEAELGRLERGVYAIETSLRWGDEVIEARPREPLVVLGEIPMKEVEGESYEEGMKVRLEDLIDFTDPDDPHPWIETSGGPKEAEGVPPAVTEPRIVRKEGLVYRETAAIEGHQYSRGAPFFSYQFEFEQPGSLYMMVLEYPNDADRWIGVSCSTTVVDVHNNSKAGPSVWTGGKYPLTGTMQELRWIYRSGPGPHTIDIVAMQKGCTAAAARLRIYRIDELPALKTDPGGERRLGLLTERTTRWTGFGKTFGRTYQAPRSLPMAPADFRSIGERLQYLRDCLDACEQYARYLRFTGQNLHVMGCFQYNDGNTPFGPPACLPTSRVPRDLREMAVRVFGKNGIEVIASIEYDGHGCLREEYPCNDGQVAAGADTALLVSKEGKQPEGRPPNERGYSPGWNFLHPRVEEPMLSVAEELAEKFKDQPNFRGVN